MSNLPPGVDFSDCEYMSETRMAIDAYCDSCDLAETCDSDDDLQCPLIQNMLIDKGLKTEEDFK